MRRAAALALLLAGCAATAGNAPPATTAVPAQAPAAAAAAPRPRVPRFPDPASPEWIAGRIAEVEARRSGGDAADPEGALALELALLYSHPANPIADHVRALAMMRAFLALAPPGARDPLVLHVAGLLEDIEQLGKIARDARTREKELSARVKSLEQGPSAQDQDAAAAKKREQELQAQVAALQQQVAAQQQQIATLQQRIEQLQQLDLEMEKRRRSVK